MTTVLIKATDQRQAVEGEDPSKVYVNIECTLSENIGGATNIGGYVPIDPALSDVEFRAALIDSGVALMNTQIIGFVTLTIADARMP